MIKSLASAAALLVLVGLIVTSCGTTDDEVVLNFKMTYNDDPLVMFNDVEYGDGRMMQFSRVSFYISELELTNANNTLGNIDVDFLKLSDAHLSLEDAQEGFPIVVNIDELGSLDKLNFNIGLTADLNATTPVDYRSSSPLSRTGEYWPGWESYIFVKFEGDIDLNGNGQYDAGETFSLHVGSNNAMRSYSFDLSDSQDSYDVTIDIAKVFNNNGTLYDIDGQPRMGSLTDQTLINIKVLSDNLQGAVEL